MEPNTVIIEKPESVAPEQCFNRGFDIPLPQKILNIENKLRSNLFAWRGQFSPQLVEALLEAYAGPSTVILDPFMGSGTVLVESARQGHVVYGVEINPAAYSIARLYEFCSLPSDIRRQDLAEAEGALKPVLDSNLPLLSNDHFSTVNLPKLAASNINPRVRALMEAVIVLVNTSDETQKSSLYRQRWHELKKTVLSLPVSEKPVRAFLGDARQIELPDKAVDLVISSPPYINVFNYHHNYRCPVEALGWKPLVVARSEIGSNRKFRQNRYLTVIQYCIDMALVLAELRRLGKDSLRVVLVVGRESNVQKTPFFNGEIVESLATQITGFQTVLKQERVFVNRFGQSIFEDLLHLEPRSQPNSSIDQTIHQSRLLGRAILADARRRVPHDRMVFFEEAINLAGEVPASPVLLPHTVRTTV